MILWVNHKKIQTLQWYFFKRILYTEQMHTTQLSPSRTKRSFEAVKNIHKIRKKRRKYYQEERIINIFFWTDITKFEKLDIFLFYLVHRHTEAATYGQIQAHQTLSKVLVHTMLNKMMWTVYKE